MRKWNRYRSHHPLEILALSMKTAEFSEPVFSTPEAVASRLPSRDAASDLLASLDQIADSIESVNQSDMQGQLDQPPELTVIVPAYNEIGTLEEVIQAVYKLPVTKQIIVVDDGSTDGTRELIGKLAETYQIEPVFHEVNSGKGAAIQTGFAKAVGDIVIVQDADLEYTPEDILKVIAPIQSGIFSVVYGSRYLDGTRRSDSWHHKFGNQVLTWFSNLASGHRLTDMETCYKAFRREILSSIQIEQKRFGFEPEITAKLARNKISIFEVPIRYAPRSWSSGKKIGVKDLFEAVWCILRYRFGS